VLSSKVKGAGTKDSPWQLTTPSGSSEYQMYKDEAASPPSLVCVVGKTELRYQLRAIEDLHKMLKANGDWMPLGSADEQKPAAEGTVEAWGRSPKNPVGGWYGAPQGLTAGGLGYTCRPCSRPSARRGSSTAQRTTGCARLDALRSYAVGTVCIQPCTSGAAPRWMSTRVWRRRMLTAPGFVSPTGHEPLADFTAPTGVITAAVPHAKTSVSEPSAPPARHWSTLIRPSSTS